MCCPLSATALQYWRNSQAAAESFCQDQGGRLASFSNLNQMNALVELMHMGNPVTGFFSVGLQVYDDDSGNFTDGTSADFASKVDLIDPSASSYCPSGTASYQPGCGFYPLDSRRTAGAWENQAVTGSHWFPCASLWHQSCTHRISRHHHLREWTCRACLH